VLVRCKPTIPDAEELYKARRPVSIPIFRSRRSIAPSSCLRTPAFWSVTIFRDGPFAVMRKRPESHHDHLIDIQTGSVIEFRNEDIEKLQRRVAEELGFELVDPSAWNCMSCRRGAKKLRLMQTLRAYGIVAVFPHGPLLLGIPYQSAALRFGWKSRKTFPNQYHRFMAKLFWHSRHGDRHAGRGPEGVPDRRQSHIVDGHHCLFSAVGRVSFVAKSEVATWPLFSTLGEICNERFFVERTRRSATGEARDQIRERLPCGRHTRPLSRRHIE